MTICVFSFWLRGFWVVLGSTDITPFSFVLFLSYEVKKYWLSERITILFVFYYIEYDWDSQKHPRGQTSWLSSVFTVSNRVAIPFLLHQFVRSLGRRHRVYVSIPGPPSNTWGKGDSQYKLAGRTFQSTSILSPDVTCIYLTFFRRIFCLIIN